MNFWLFLANYRYLNFTEIFVIFNYEFQAYDTDSLNFTALFM